MKESIGKTVAINGSSKTAYYCFECGESLNIDDYVFGDGRCGCCRSKTYDRNEGRYIDLGGNNQIDEILLKKREER